MATTYQTSTPFIKPMGWPLKPRFPLTTSAMNLFPAPEFI
jgi:hypothetical protein